MRASLTISARIVILLASAAFSLAQSQSVTLTSSATRSLETENSSIDLRGTAAIGKTAQSKIGNVTWVNQAGERGTGTWFLSGRQLVNWEALGVPLRLGINQIAVTVVDESNKSASMHVVVHRKSPPGTQPTPALPVRPGMWRNRPITYQVWNGQPVVEGDIILVAPAGPRSGASPQGLTINYTSQLWPVVGGVHQIPYIITGSSANLTSAISSFNSTFTGLLQFVARTSQSNYVNINVGAGAAGGGYSNVGVVGGVQTLFCDSACTVSTWLHEMGHTCGLLHEHQRPDRASYLAFNFANADLPNVPGNFSLFSFDYQTVGLYDYASVMHYGAFGFSKAGLPVMESIPAGIPLGNNYGYSAGDIDQLQRLYAAAPATVTVTTNPVGLGIVVDGTSYTSPHAFSWALNSSHSLTVAADPQYTSPADGSTYAFGNWNDLGAKSHTITVTPGSGTLALPANAPAVSVYEANFVRLQPFAFQSPDVYPSGTGTISLTPAPLAQYGGNFYPDRTLVSMTMTPTAGSGYNFYGWFNLPYPPADNPHSFYIQSPVTQAQAIFVPTAVTIVGETISGPNTWNPGLAGYVDGSFNYLPTAFSSYYNGAAWDTGTTHSIAMNQTQSPVTTNVFYNWNNWSDAGAITHNITQPASGSQTVSASVTPFYASYTAPPALGSPSAACYGGVSTSPAGVSYAANTAFPFYADGASVTATATANATYPGMVFTGWTGSLSGTVNPNTTTIHDQFVPTALFNIAADTLAITSLSPASAPAGSGTLDITINGTGFTPTATYVYWNGSYRSVTYVSSTKLTLHLNAGDLAAAGGQDIYVGNYSTSASSGTCGVSAQTSFILTVPPPTPPTGVSASPSSGSGLTQAFTAVYSDLNGYADLGSVRLLFNTFINGVNACYVYYTQASDALYLANDANTGSSAGVTPGSASSVSNTQCTLAGTGSSVVKSGNNITVTFALTFANTYSGYKNIYLKAISNGGLTADWIQKGSWTPISLGSPTIVSVSPASGSGLTQAFTAVYSDPNGTGDLNTVRLLFNTAINGVNACYVYYAPASNNLYLVNNANTGSSAGIAPGSASTASNSQCTLAGTGSSVAKSGNNITVTFALTFANTFAGIKNTYLKAINNGGIIADWTKKGTWTPISLGPPTLISISPNNGSGVTQAFTAVYSDPNGTGDLNTARLLFNTAINGVNACYVYYAPALNGLYLVNDANTGSSAAVTPGSVATVSNSQCTLAGAGSSVSTAGANLSVTFALSFSGTFTGSRNSYLKAINNASVVAEWVQKGTWTP